VKSSSRLKGYLWQMVGVLVYLCIALFSRRPKYMSKPDANQPEIVETLTQLGFLVVNVSPYLTTPDLFVWGYHATYQAHVWTAWEVKTPVGELSTAQKEFFRLWPQAVKLCRASDDVLTEYGRFG